MEQITTADQTEPVIAPVAGGSETLYKMRQQHNLRKLIKITRSSQMQEQMETQ